MTGIVRQSDQYAAFDNTPRAERVANEDPPEDVIAGFTRGRSVGAGMNNPKGIKRQHFAGDVDQWGWENEHPHADPDAEELSYRDPHMTDDYYAEPPTHGPGGYPHDDDPNAGYDTPLQPLDDMVEHYRRPPPPSFNLARRRTADDGPGMDFSGGDVGGGDFGGQPIGNDLFTYMFLQRNPHMLSEILGT